MHYLPHIFALLYKRGFLWSGSFSNYYITPESFVAVTCVSFLNWSLNILKVSHNERLNNNCHNYTRSNRKWSILKLCYETRYHIKHTENFMCRCGSHWCNNNVVYRRTRHFQQIEQRMTCKIALDKICQVKSEDAHNTEKIEFSAMFIPLTPGTKLAQNHTYKLALPPNSLQSFLLNLTVCHLLKLLKVILVRNWWEVALKERLIRKVLKWS